IFGVLAFFDVGGGRVPSNNGSVLVDDRVVPKEEPAKLTVSPEHPLLDFERSARGKAGTSLTLNSFEIVWMHVSVDPLKRTRAFHFLERISLVVQHGPVGS